MAFNKIALAGLLLFISSALIAQETNISQAKEIAENYLVSKNEYKGISQQTSLSLAYQSPDTVQNSLYCFQNDPEGFIIIAETGRGFIVTGYSPDGVFDYKTINPGLKELLIQYEQASYSDVNTTIAADRKGVPLTVAPLLDIESINWGQGFNQECPFDTDAGMHTLAGCVAVSMAEIMRYHKYPLSGNGSHSYTHPKYGVISADFENTVYRWDNMPGDESSPNSFIDTLMFHCGVGTEMNYGPYASSAYVSKAREAFNSYFKYPDAQYIQSFDYTDNLDFFYQLLRDEIANNRPVLYELPGTPGHSVVCDGYDETLFHLNFGWNGSSNGYYLLEGTMDGYYMRGNAIIGISPTRIVTDVQDSLALVAIYNSTNGDQWLRKGGWLNEPVIKWQGVTTINGHVVKLNLSANKLAGSIPIEIGDLSSLIWLNLSNNSLSGKLPAEIGLLTNLKFLEIKYAGLTGSIPAETGNLLKLLTLDLSANQLTGNIPDAIYNLTSLTNLSLSGNMLTGNLSPLAGQLTKLKIFNVWGNQLSGTLPDEIGNMIDLTDFGISNNLFSGTIPETISSWTNLTTISLFENSFEGALPDAIINFTKLSRLNISKNLFTSLPENIGQLSLLQTIEANDNLITSIPPSVSQLSALFRLNLYNNSLTSIPDLGEMPALWDLQLSNNQIESLPETFGSFKKLSSLSIGNNNISELPSSFENLSTLKMIYLGGNKLKTIPVSFCFLSSLEELYLNNNEIEGPMPPLNFLGLKYVDIKNNKMVFSDIASSLMPDDTIYNDTYEFNYYDQASVEVTDSVFSFAQGDSAGVDIRAISRLSHQNNTYEWYRDNDLIQEGAILNFPTFSTENAGSYYCMVRNTKYKKVLVLETKPITLKLVSNDPLEDAKIVSSRESSTPEFSDNLVMLQPASDLRGALIWQASSDSINWFDVSEDMEDEIIKQNIISIADNKITIEPKTNLLFRYQVSLENCDPVVSDTIRIMSYSDLLIDTLLNVRDRMVTIETDSIEITIPANFTDKDFRLTIKKLNHPPEAPSSKILASVYDVSVSIGSVFELPLLIKLKNINKDAFLPENIDRYRAAYFDEKLQEWIPYDNSSLVLQDSSIVFETNHLTKLSWLWDTEVLSGYTDVFVRNNIRVYYKELDEGFLNSIYGKSQTVQPWHLTVGDPEYGTPKQIQDIAYFLYEVMEAFRALGLPVPDFTFSVYVKEMDDYGNVGLMGLMNHYLNINRDTESPELLRSVLAHEFMHYTQNNYISAHAGNIFWLEANAHLSDRLVWNESVIPISESEKYLLESRTGENNIFKFLSTSWDHWDKGLLTQNALGNVNYCYLAGTIIHYMRSYKEGVKLNPVALLKETPYTQSWLEYLDSYTQQYLSSNIGDQYEDYVKYIVESSEPDFGLINAKEEEDPLKFFKTASSEFMTNKFFKFGTTSAIQSLKDSIHLEMPYLSSQMVQMYNLNAGYQKALVKYKRNSLQNENNKVYLCRYDNDSKKITFEDITAVDSSAFVIESPAGTNMVEKKHVAWLLFINKDKAEDFTVSYDLQILPVPDITFLDFFAFTINYANSQAEIHTFTDGTNETTGIFHLMPGVYREFADEYYSTLYTSVEMNDETVVAHSYSDWMEQTVTLNFITGDMVFYEKENWGGLDPTSTIDVREMTMVLKNVWLLPYPPGSTGRFHFETFNSTQTKDVVQSIEYTRKYALYDYAKLEHNAVVTTTYTGTNYTDANGDDIENITFHLLFY